MTVEVEKMDKYAMIYNGFLNYAHAAIVQIQTPTGRRLVLDKSDPHELIEMLTEFLNDHNHDYEILDDGTLSLQVRGDDGEFGRLYYLTYSDFDPVVKTFALNYFDMKGWSKPTLLLEYELEYSKNVEAAAQSVVGDCSPGSVERRIYFSKKDTTVKPVTVQEIKNLMKVADSVWIQEINKGLRGAASAEYPAFMIVLPSEALVMRMHELYQKEGFKCYYHLGNGNVSLEFNLGALKDE